jgi:lysylphosphatidylglycerol synthetase-like protein (DUF2156 family)
MVDNVEVVSADVLTSKPSIQSSVWLIAVLACLGAGVTAFAEAFTVQPINWLMIVMATVTAAIGAAIAVLRKMSPDSIWPVAILTAVGSGVGAFVVAFAVQPPNWGAIIMATVTAFVGTLVAVLQKTSAGQPIEGLFSAPRSVAAPKP